MHIHASQLKTPLCQVHTHGCYVLIVSTFFFRFTSSQGPPNISLCQLLVPIFIYFNSPSLISAAHVGMV